MTRESRRRFLQALGAGCLASVAGCNKSSEGQSTESKTDRSTATPTATPTATLTPTTSSTPSPTATRSPSPTATPSPSPTSTPTPGPGKVSAEFGDTNDRFGNAVATSGTTVLVGAEEDEDPNGKTADSGGAGAVYVFEWTGEAWQQQRKLVAEDGAAGDAFGSDVALDGDTALVGAPGADTDAGASAGAAYVFQRSNGLWFQRAKLVAAGGARNDHFGDTVALDGDTALVASVAHDDSRGVVYAFERSGDSWSQKDRFAADDVTAGDRFGYALELDADVAVVGAVSDDFPNGTDSGTAFVFERIIDDWEQQTKLAPDDLDPEDSFGRTVSISGDTALVGAPGDEDPNGDSGGSAFVFERSNGAWTKTAKLVADDGDDGDRFGFSVELDGDRALVGAKDDEDPNGAAAGSAYLFDGSGEEWTSTTKLAPEDGDYDDQFGWAVTLRGNVAVVGAPSDEDPNGNGAGSAYVFRV